MIHFLFAIPRLIFLTSPLIFLIFGRSNVLGYLPAILAYAFPHLIISTATNSRIQGKHRHSFWNEIYEIALTPYILFPTCLALINPKWGKFNVTGKEGVVAGSYFDFQIARPFLVLLALNLTSIGFGLWKYFHTGDPNGVIRINCFWSFFNCILLAATMSVAYERRQRRVVTRVKVPLPLELTLNGGAVVGGLSVDVSMGGMNVSLAQNMALDAGERGIVNISLFGENQSFPVTVVKSRGSNLRIRFTDLNLAQEAALVRAVFSRADSWLDWSRSYQLDRPLRSLFAVMALSVRGIGGLIAGIISPRVPVPHPSRLAPSKDAAVLLITLLACGCAVVPGLRAESGDRSAKRPETAASVIPSFQDSWQLDALGEKRGIGLRGDRTKAQVSFGMTPTKLVTNARISVSMQVQNGVAANSRIDLSLNGSPAGSILVNSSGGTGSTATRHELTLPAELFTTENTLTFEFVGSCTGEAGCDLAGNDIWARITPDSTISVSGTLVPVPNDLNLLTDAFLSNYSGGQVQLPFVFDSQSSARPAILEAAGATASWLGIKAGTRGVRFGVRFGQIPSGDVIIVATRDSSLVQTFALPASSEPLVAIRENPVDPYGKVLVITGQNDKDVLNAARALVISKFNGSGDTAQLSDVSMPPARRAYDAPRWQPTEHDIRLTDGMTDADLRVRGNGAVNFHFQLSPDIYYGSRETVPLHLRYRCGESTDTTAIVKIFLNGAFVVQRSVSLQTKNEVREMVIPLPAVSLYAGNTLSVEFTFDGPRHNEHRRSSLDGSVAPVSEAAVLRGTEIIVRGMSHFVEMPRLDLFANSGFPFTRMADLSETVVMIPPSHRADTIAVFLTAVAFMGAQTGYPALRVEVSDSGRIPEKSHKDFLVIGSFENQPALKALASQLVVEVSEDGARVNSLSSLFDPAELLSWRADARTRSMLGSIIETILPEAIIQSVRSPLDRTRTMVVITPGARGNLNTLLEQWPNPVAGTQITGNVAVLSGGEFRSVAFNRSRYRTGHLSVWQGMQFWAERYFFAIPLLVFGAIFLMSDILHRQIELQVNRRLAIAQEWKDTCNR